MIHACTVLEGARRRRSLERLLVVQLLALRNLEALLGRVENGLDLLDQTILLLLKLGVLIDSLLYKQFDIAQLAEVEVAFPLQTHDRLLERGILLLKGRIRDTTAASLDAYARPSSRGHTSGTSRSGAASGRTSSRATAAGQCAALPPSNGIVVATWEVLVPELLRPLQEVQVVLHLAFHELLDRNHLVDVVLCERICGRNRVSADAVNGPSHQEGTHSARS